jgi:hypothetical protein
MVWRTIAVSWGPVSGGVYITRERICLGRIAITRIGVEIDELMRSFVEECDLQRENALLRSVESAAACAVDTYRGKGGHKKGMAGAIRDLRATLKDVRRHAASQERRGA